MAEQLEAEMNETHTEEEMSQSCAVKLVHGEGGWHLEVDCPSEELRDAFAKALESEAIIRVTPKEEAIEQETAPNGSIR